MLSSYLIGRMLSAREERRRLASAWMAHFEDQIRQHREGLQRKISAWLVDDFLPALLGARPPRPPGTR